MGLLVWLRSAFVPRPAARARGEYAVPMPPSPEEQAAIKRRLRTLDVQPWVRAMVEKLIAERRAKRAARAAAPLRAPALSGQN